jgi:glycosyltransferase involved in cell wall biosynthesis
MTKKSFDGTAGISRKSKRIRIVCGKKNMRHPVFYIFFHSYDYVPMHASDVIDELIRAGERLHVFTAVNPEHLKDCDWRLSASVTNIRIMRHRIYDRLSYAVQLLFVLPFWCLISRPSLIYERISMMTVLTAAIARLFRIPLITEINGITLEELRLGKASSRRIAFMRWCEGFSLRNSTRSITVNSQIRQWLLSTYNIDPPHVKVITNGTNTRRFCPMDHAQACAKRQLAPQKKFYVGYLGTLTPWCGVDLLVQASANVLRRHPEVEFLIGGGEEPYFTQFKNMAAQNNAKNAFHFFGQIQWPDAAQFIAAFDIAIVSLMPYPVSGSPQKLYAYLACGKPVIGSDIGEISSVLAQGVGRTFVPRDPNSLADAICYSVKNSGEIRAMAKKARDLVINNHSWELRVRQLLAYLADVRRE